MAKTKRISRRDFLKAASIAATGLTVVACQPKTVVVKETVQVEKEVTKVVKETIKETVVVEGTPKVIEKEVTKVVKEIVTATPVPVAGPDEIAIWSPCGQGDVADWEYDPILAVVEEATNTQIEMVNVDWGAFIDQINAAAASGQVPDIIGVISHEDRAVIQSWVRDGVVAAYEDQVAAAAPNVLVEYEMNPTLNEIKIDGKIYMQPVGWGDGLYPNMGLLHVRKDLLDRYKLEAPDTFEQYVEFLRAAVEDGSTGVVFDGSGGLGSAINAFAGAYNLPFRGFVQVGDRYECWAVQPGIQNALLLFRQMVAEGLVDPASWEGSVGRDEYVAGQGCSLIFNGGGHTGRIQNDMDVAGYGGQEWMLPAPDAGLGFRGYTSEAMFWGASFLGGMENNNPVAAARVINFLISDEGYRLTAVGIEGRDYTMEGDEIVLLPQRTKDGFPEVAGDTGAHPLATCIVSWVPQEWQNWQLLYGKDQAYKEWFEQMWENQGQYQIPAYGILSTSPLWTDFQPTSNELISRTFLAVVQAASEDEAKGLFNDFVLEWRNSGGEEAQREMSDRLAELYA
jgi:putative aldouronate transport system substrate-binding protein